MNLFSNRLNKTQSAAAPVNEEPIVAVWWHYHDPDTGTLIIENLSSKQLDGVMLSLQSSKTDIPKLTIPISQLPHNETLTIKLADFTQQANTYFLRFVESIKVYEGGIFRQCLRQKENHFMSEYQKEAFS